MMTRKTIIVGIVGSLIIIAIFGSLFLMLSRDMQIGKNETKKFFVSGKITRVISDGLRVADREVEVANVDQFKNEIERAIVGKKNVRIDFIVKASGSSGSYRNQIIFIEKITFLE